MKPLSTAVYLLLYTSILSFVSCQERSPFVSTKIDVVCSKGRGCISDCDQPCFCLDKRVHGRGSPSYILDDRVLFLRGHLVQLTNDSVVALITESFEMPLSLFSPETFSNSPVRQAVDPSKIPVFDTFSELQAQEKTLSRLRVGDPYCVWQLDKSYWNCPVHGQEGSLTAGFYLQDTGSFGLNCNVKQF